MNEFIPLHFSRDNPHLKKKYFFKLEITTLSMIKSNEIFCYYI